MGCIFLDLAESLKLVLALQNSASMQPRADHFRIQYIVIVKMRWISDLHPRRINPEENPEKRLDSLAVVPNYNTYPLARLPTEHPQENLAGLICDTFRRFFLDEYFLQI